MSAGRSASRLSAPGEEQDDILRVLSTAIRPVNSPRRGWGQAFLPACPADRNVCPTSMSARYFFTVKKTGFEA